MGKEACSLLSLPSLSGFDSCMSPNFSRGISFLSSTLNRLLPYGHINEDWSGMYLFLLDIPWVDMDLLEAVTIAVQSCTEYIRIFLAPVGSSN